MYLDQYINTFGKCGATTDEDQNDTFNASRAEVFEALGHPTRIRILQTLSEKQPGFSELKRETGIESSGLLAFHLGKLAGLVKLNPEGSYTLSDDGREALRMIEASKNQQHEGPRSQKQGFHLAGRKAVLAGLLVALVVIGSVAVYQQEQISSLNHQLRSGMVEIGGAMYWNEAFPALAPNGTSVTFHGVTFTSVSPSFQYSYSDPSKYIFNGSVRLSNGTVLNLTGKSVEISFAFKPPNYVTENGTARWTGAPQPAVAVTLPSGEREVYGGYDVTAVHASANYNIPNDFTILNVTYHPVVVNPWFTAHTGPQAGVLWNYTNNQLTYYVSSN